MGCSHCLEDATPSGEHMSMELFERALRFTERAERMVIQANMPVMVMFSGGECTDHPNIVEMVEMVTKRGWIVTLLTHGLWLDNVELRNKLLLDDVFVQVTNDDRYYPRKPPKFEHERVIYVDRLQVLSTLGRAASTNFDSKGLSQRAAPSSFNLRSLTRATGSIASAIMALRMRWMLGKSGFCTPSVSHDGTIVAGESRFCYPIGTVDSTNEELTQAILAMGECNRCGQEAVLRSEYKQAIGIKT